MEKITSDICICVCALNEEIGLRRLVSDLEEIDLCSEPKIKWVLVNDGSSDNTYEIMQQCKLKNKKIISNECNIGKAESLAKVIEKSSESWIICLDADVIMVDVKAFVSGLKSLIEMSPDVGLVCAPVVCSVGRGIFARAERFASDVNLFLCELEGNTPTVMGAVGRCLALRLRTAVTWAATRRMSRGGEDAEIFVTCRSIGGRVVWMPSFAVSFMPPLTLVDYLKQARRFRRTRAAFSEAFRAAEISRRRFRGLVIVFVVSRKQVRGLVSWLYVKIIAETSLLMTKDSGEWGIALTSKKQGDAA